MPELAAFTMASAAKVVMSPRHKRRRGSVGDGVVSAKVATPASAMLAAIIYNALIIVALIPLALRGVKCREASPHRLLARNLAVYGLGGVIVPFAAIKALDALMVFVGVA